MTRIVVADDQPLFREGLRAVLTVDPTLEVVAEASSGEEAVYLAVEHRAEVVLMDLQMPNMGGIEATRRLGVALPTCRVLVLTTFDDNDLIFDALRAGAVGYLLKDATGERLREAVRGAAAGKAFLDPTVTSKVLAEFVRVGAAPAPPPSLLTERETDVFRLLCKGASNKEIAAALFVSEGTVKNHVTQILAKLGVSDRTQAALKGRVMGFG
jgi:DNA-binding NarL/FixJ family response regulator